MPLMFGMPDGITDAMESALAAMQTAFGKVDAQGKWIDVVKDGAGLAGYLHIDGVGNSWTQGTATSHVGTTISYMLVGNTMFLDFTIANTALTIATAAIGIYLKVPDGFTSTLRTHHGKGWMINAGAALGALVTTGTANYISIVKDTAAAYVDDSGGAFSVGGSLAFEVTRT